MKSGVTGAAGGMGPEGQVGLGVEKRAKAAGSNPGSPPICCVLGHINATSLILQGDRGWGWGMHGRGAFCKGVNEILYTLCWVEFLHITTWKLLLSLLLFCGEAKPPGDRHTGA